MAGETVLKDEEVDKLVIGWLKKRELKEALKVLELELQVKGQGGQTVQTEAAEQLWLHNKNDALNKVLLATAGQGDPASYASQYAQFEDWVDGSLDAFRPELLRMLYPIFVHTYLELLALGAGSAAQEMLSHSRARFLSGTAVSSNSGKGRVAELNELSSLSTPQHLDTSSLARSVRAKRAPVRLSQYAYDLALQYLRQHDLALVLGMINRWLAVEVTESSGAAGVVEGGSLLSMLGGSMDSAAVNQAPIDTKLLKDSAMHQHSVRKAEQAEREAAEKTQDESLTKKQLAELQKLAEEARKQLDAAKANCIEPQIPLPPVAQEHTDALLQDLDVCETAGAGGKPLGPDALPSAAMFTFVNTKQTMNCVAVSSEADCIAAGFADASVRLYRLKGDPAMTTFTGHTGPVYGADFSPDDQLLLSSGADGTVRLWSMELSTGLVAFTGHMLPVWDVAFAPDQGYYFASASADRTARLWCTERSQALRVLAGHQGDVDVVRWHPNCQYVATGSSDHTVRLWDLRDGSCVRLLEGHNKAITAMSFSSDGASLATADEAGVLISWDLGSARPLATTLSHAGPIWSLAYSKGSSKVLASGGADCAVRLWSECEAQAVVPGAQQPPTEDGVAAPAHTPLATWFTKATPVVAASFTRRNLLLTAGPLSVQDVVRRP